MSSDHRGGVVIFWKPSEPIRRCLLLHCDEMSFVCFYGTRGAYRRLYRSVARPVIQMDRTARPIRLSDRSKVTEPLDARVDQGWVLRDGVEWLSVRTKWGDVAAFWREDLVPFRGIVFEMDRDGLDESFVELLVSQMFLRLKRKQQVGKSGMDRRLTIVRASPDCKDLQKDSAAESREERT
jgi:hypothetical protein